MISYIQCYRIVSIVLLFVSLSMSIVVVSTCAFVKIKDGPYIGLIADYGAPYEVDICRIDYWDDYYWNHDKPDFDDNASVIARVYGFLSVAVGVVLCVLSLMSIFYYPRWMWLVMMIFSCMNALFESMTLLIFESDSCTGTFEYYDPYNYYRPTYDCYRYDMKRRLQNFNFTRMPVTNPSNRTREPTISPSYPTTKPPSYPTTIPLSYPTPPPYYFTPTPTSKPSYCRSQYNDYGSYADGNIYRSYYNIGNSIGDGCKLSSGAAFAIATTLLWLGCGILLLFRRPSGKVLAGSSDCCVSSNDPHDPLPTPPVGVRPHLDLNYSSKDLKKVVKETINSDGSKTIVTTYEPICKEKTVVTEYVNFDGTKVIKHTNEKYDLEES